VSVYQYSVCDMEGFVCQWNSTLSVTGKGLCVLCNSTLSVTWKGLCVSGTVLCL
jgi:hypothetical protein